MAFKKDPDELVIWDEKNQIIFHPYILDYLGGDWEGDYWVDTFDGNRIEISFREDEEDGWGVGGDEYITTADIKAMGDCIRGVINKETPAAKYSCLDDIFRLELSYHAENDTYTFTVALLEFLIRDHHIAVTKIGLSREELDEYISPFFIWEQKFPVIEGDGKVYERKFDEERARLPKPYCDEMILRTHHMQTGIGDEEMWERPDYHQPGRLVYHALPDFWLVFETEHYYISVGSDGVNKYESVQDLKGNDRELWNDPVTGVEEIVFPGRCIEAVAETEAGWEIHFDSFNMDVVRHEKDDGFEGSEYKVEAPFFGFSHILNKCACGGYPEFMMDRHCDFYVQCPICDRYTYADYNPDHPVNDWNTGNVHCLEGHEDITRIFIKLDGVLADFRRGVMEMCHMDTIVVSGENEKDHENRMWEEIRKVEHFYNKLEFVPGAKEMFDLIYDRYGKRCEIIISLPLPRRKIIGCRADEIEWVRRNLSEDIKLNIESPLYFHNLCSGSNCVLITDNEKSIKDWEIYEGTGILFTNAHVTIETLKEKGLL